MILQLDHPWKWWLQTGTALLCMWILNTTRQSHHELVLYSLLSFISDMGYRFSRFFHQPCGIYLERLYLSFSSQCRSCYCYPKYSTYVQREFLSVQKKVYLFKWLLFCLTHSRWNQWWRSLSCLSCKGTRIFLYACNYRGKSTRALAYHLPLNH